MNKVLVVSNHHRRCGLFEETMRLLLNKGYSNIYIQHTGCNNSWSNYNGPKIELWNAGQLPYDAAMINLGRRLKSIPGEIIALIDNDCFLSGTDYFERYLQEFIDGDYDYVCHLVTAPDMLKRFDGITNNIVEVTDLSFPLSNDIYGFVPEPHFENAYLLMKKSLFDQMTSEDLSNSRKMLRAAHRLGAKIGAHRAKYKLTYSHYGEEWFHIGNLMAYYHAVENNNHSKFCTDSELDMSRLGYLIDQRDRFGITHPNLDRIIVGREAIALDAWRNLYEGFC